MSTKKNRADTPERQPYNPRSWLPKPGIERYFNTKLLMVLSSFVLTVLVTLAVEQMVTQSVYTWLKIALPALTNTIFGLFLSNWWERSRANDKHYTDAIRIDEEVDRSLLEVSQSWQQIIHALNTLAQHSTPEFLSAARFILGAQLNDVYKEMQEASFRLGRLGYNSKGFFREKKERMKVIREDVAALLKNIPNGRDLAGVWESFVQNDEAMPTNQLTVINVTPPALEAPATATGISSTNNEQSTKGAEPPSSASPVQDASEIKKAA